MPSSNEDDSHDDLTLDHVHIHLKNWQWIHKRRELVFTQGSKENYIGGHIGFSDDSVNGSGSVHLGSKAKVESVRFSYMQPTYTCDLSTNAGAYVVTDGLTLKWDTTSDEWKNATLSTDAMKFTYWVEKDGCIGNQKLWHTATVFSDARAGVLGMYNLVDLVDQVQLLPFWIRHGCSPFPSMMAILQLTALLPSFMDPGSNWDETT